ncbi:MAG: hypothetical protein GC154_09140 [bacterium]|nr:hypothetical protein [bacterium]
MTNEAYDYESGFWRRQFEERTTPLQHLFDGIFGVLTPLGLLLVNPIALYELLFWFIRRNPVHGSAGDAPFPFTPYLFLTLFSDYADPSYSFILLETSVLWACMAGFWRTPVSAGVLILGATGSFVIGISILPFALVGTQYIVGILGFAPLFSAFVYFRNGVRTLKSAPPESRLKRKLRFLCGALLAAAIPLTIWWIACE